MTSEALCLGTSTYPTLCFNTKNYFHHYPISSQVEELKEVDSLWSGGDKLLICLSARTSISSHRTPNAFCQEFNNLGRHRTIPVRSHSTNPAAREPGWDAAGDVALPQQQAPLGTRGTAVCLQHLERDAAALSQRQIAITKWLRGVLPPVSTGWELDAGKKQYWTIATTVQARTERPLQRSSWAADFLPPTAAGATASSRKRMEQLWGKGAAAEVAASQGSAAAAWASVRWRAAGDFRLHSFWPRVKTFGTCGPRPAVTALSSCPAQGDVSNPLNSNRAQGARRTTGRGSALGHYVLGLTSHLGTWNVQSSGRYQHPSAPMWALVRQLGN